MKVTIKFSVIPITVLSEVCFVLNKKGYSITTIDYVVNQLAEIVLKYYADINNKKFDYKFFTECMNPSFVENMDAAFLFDKNSPYVHTYLSQLFNWSASHQGRDYWAYIDKEIFSYFIGYK